MPASTPVARLGALTGGVNRFRPEARQGQCVDALNVYEDKGALRRRPAFKAIQTSAPFTLPAGKSVVGHLTAAGVVTIEHDRARTYTKAQLPAGDGILVGCEDVFHGIDWSYVSLANTTPTGHRKLEASFWNGSTWVVLSGVVDTTVSVFAYLGNLFIHTLAKNGLISWHKDHVSTWAARTDVDGRSLYLMRLRLVSGDGTTQDAETDFVLSAPGPKSFLLEPVKSILPYRAKSGLDSIILASDRGYPLGSEAGANLAIVRGGLDRPEVPLLVDDRGACIIGEVAVSEVNAATPGEAWPGGTWTTIAASSGSQGQPDILTKHDESYEWGERQFRGALIVGGIDSTGSSVSIWGGMLKTSALVGAFDSVPDGAWAGFRIRCTQNSSGGTPVGEEREILGVLSDSLYYAPRFSTDPNAGNLFEVLTPHGRIRIRNSDFEYEVADRTTNPEHLLDMTTGAAYEAELDSGDNDKQGHFVVGQRVVDRVPGGRLWTSLFDMTTRKILLQSDRSGLLEYDGLTLVRHVAESDDKTSARVRQWVGALPEQARDLLSSSALAGSKLRLAPPKGEYVVDFRGRTVMVVAPYSIVWSAPSPDNDIWPKLYETQIRDADNDPITALFVHSGMLCVATPTAIHGSSAPDDTGMFRMQPISQGIGFLAHRSVVAAAKGVTLGVTADGIYQFNGAGLAPVLDDWRRLLPNGVNEARLKDSVAASSVHDAKVYFAVPSAGSQVNDRILVYDLEKRVWWVWSAPWGGISSMARDNDANGRERVLFGTNDGHLAVLANNQTDDGDVVTGYARAAPIQGDGTSTFGPIAASVVAHELGSGTLTVRSFLNEHGVRDAPSHALVPKSSPAAIYGTSDYASDGSSVFGNALVQKKFHFSSAARCESFEVEVRGSELWRLRSLEIEISGRAVRESK